MKGLQIRDFGGILITSWPRTKIIYSVASTDKPKLLAITVVQGVVRIADSVVFQRLTIDSAIRYWFNVAPNELLIMIMLRNFVSQRN